MTIASYDALPSNLNSPGEDAFVITPADGSDLTSVSKLIWVGTAGNLNVDTKAGTTILFKNVPVGWFDGCRVKRVRSTNTTAADLVGVV